jgi:hypothetical protein
MVENLRPLKEALLHEYGTFADKRIKNIDRGDRFIVDDRTINDVGADRGLYGWFCSMFLDVQEPKAVDLWLERTLPMSPAVADVLERAGAEQRNMGYRIRIDPENLETLTDLSVALRAIVRPGARYDTPSHKYVCPRTAGSLERLCNALKQHWG